MRPKLALVLLVHSCAQVLSELKEYAQEVDVDFVRKSVRAVGRCAIKVEASADRCVTALLDLIQLNSADGGIGNRYLVNPPTMLRIK